MCICQAIADLYVNVEIHKGGAFEISHCCYFIVETELRNMLQAFLTTNILRLLLIMTTPYITTATATTATTTGTTTATTVTMTVSITMTIAMTITL